VKATNRRAALGIKVGERVRHVRLNKVGRVVLLHMNRRGDVEVIVDGSLYGEAVVWFGENIERA
jgi:hypothetical protein